MLQNENGRVRRRRGAQGRKSVILRRLVFAAATLRPGTGCGNRSSHRLLRWSVSVTAHGQKRNRVRRRGMARARGEGLPLDPMLPRFGCRDDRVAAPDGPVVRLRRTGFQGGAALCRPPDYARHSPKPTRPSRWPSNYYNCIFAAESMI